jgi:DUF1680 family protein
MANLTRRRFALGTTAASLLAQEPARDITSASVPGDPIAPRVSGGTLSENLPFGPKIAFTRNDVAPRVRPFPMTDVRLLPGIFQKAQEANRKFVYEQTPDRLLHVFRLNAGIASNAEPLGGWEKPDCELRGHFVGHYLSACALSYASSGDSELKARGEYLVAELAKCQQRLSGGYLSAFPTEYFDRLGARKKVWAPFYTVHKIMAGMLDMHEHCGSAQALNVLNGMAEWTDRWSAERSEEQMQMVLDTEYGGIAETLYSMTALSGQDQFAKVGDRFIKKRFFNPLAMRRDELRGLHVNTHIPQVIAAARRYEISGDQRFHDVAEYFWQEVVGTRSYVTGGTSNNEGWLVGPNELAAELKQSSETNECCCAYNMLKLTRKLYQWTGDVRLFDYYERVLLNHRLGTINEDGQTQYYLGVAPGSWRTFATKYDSFWCCTGTGTEEFAKLNDSIYFRDEHGIYVNLFIASEVNWPEKKFRLRQETSFPEEPKTSLLVDVEQPVKLTMRVRIPGWLEGAAKVKINGKLSEVSATGGSYLAIDRTWTKGDRIEIDLPMTERFEPMADDHSLRAILHGPIVQAAKLGNEGLTPQLQIGPMGPEINKVPALKIPSLDAFQKGNLPTVPFYKLAGERYSLYWKAS